MNLIDRLTLAFKQIALDIKALLNRVATLEAQSGSGSGAGEDVEKLKRQVKALQDNAPLNFISHPDGIPFGTPAKLKTDRILEFDWSDSEGSGVSVGSGYHTIDDTLYTIDHVRRLENHTMDNKYDFVDTGTFHSYYQDYERLTNISSYSSWKPGDSIVSWLNDIRHNYYKDAYVHITPRKLSDMQTGDNRPEIFHDTFSKANNIKWVNQNHPMYIKMFANVEYGPRHIMFVGYSNNSSNLALYSAELPDENEPQQFKNVKPQYYPYSDKYEYCNSNLYLLNDGRVMGLTGDNNGDRIYIYIWKPSTVNDETVITLEHYSEITGIGSFAACEMVSAEHRVFMLISAYTAENDPKPYPTPVFIQLNADYSGYTILEETSTVTPAGLCNSGELVGSTNRDYQSFNSLRISNNNVLVYRVLKPDTHMYKYDWFGTQEPGKGYLGDSFGKALPQLDYNAVLYNFDTLAFLGDGKIKIDQVKVMTNWAHGAIPISLGRGLIKTLNPPFTRIELVQGKLNRLWMSADLWQLNVNYTQGDFFLPR